ncbi:MAG TPA: MerR family transcriptional regulator, partial [Actinomycetota bacterium]|nr:MerR family transcriptional regulator [Actinomycetota bacterium]
MDPQRTAGNSRRYSDRDVDRLRRIQELTQEEGVNLAGVRIIMDLELELERVLDQLQEAARRLVIAERELGERRRRGMLVRLSDVRNIFDPKGRE